jgi:nitroreductase
MTNYEEIFKRRSVRVYDETPLDKQTLDQIAKYIKNMKPLYRTIKTKIKIIDNIGESKIFATQPPHSAVLWSEDKASQNMNAGYLIEQLSLYLTTLGLGSCIVAAHRPKQEIIDTDNIGNYIIMLCFGKPAMEYLRYDNRQFIRKSKDNLLISGEYNDVTEACRVAPSAKNDQPWKLLNDNNKIHVYSLKIEKPSRPIYKTLDSIDIGILLYHLETAGRNNNMNGIFEFSPDGAKHAPEGYYYIISMI